MKPLPEFGLVRPQTVEVFLPEHHENTAGETWVTYPEQGIQIDAIVAAGTTTSVPENTQPYATETAYTICFPKTWEQNLEGALVGIGEHRYRVQGNPQPYQPENTPGDYNLITTVEETRNG